MNFNDGELSLEELDQVTAGMPVLPETEKVQREESVQTDLPRKHGKIDENQILTDMSRKAVEALPMGELSEEDLDNVIGGFGR